MYNNFTVSRTSREYDILEFPDLDTDDLRIFLFLESPYRISIITSLFFFLNSQFNKHII